MDAGTILRLGAAMLAFGSLGLFLVRSTNHRLRGLGWLGAGFLCGFFGALLLAVRTNPFLETIGSDAFVLIGFVLLEVAVVEMMKQRTAVPKLGLMLLAVLFVADALMLTHVLHNVRMVLMSTLVAIQCFATAALLRKLARRSERGPALFCALTLAVFAAFNIMRAVVVLTGYGRTGIWLTIVVTLTYALYIAVALGLAFGFFWMSTAQLSHQLEHMAATDPLTRLYNRRSFLQACEAEFQRTSRDSKPFSILMVDLDHFKSINDRFGHAVGDAALVAAVHAMQDSIRGSDVLARWGGEEFAALLPNADLDAAQIVAERLRLNVERIELPIELPGQTVRMTVSIGLATHAAADDISTIMGRADRHLYLAKDNGRNCVLGEKPIDAHFAALPN